MHNSNLRTSGIEIIDNTRLAIDKGYSWEKYYVIVLLYIVHSMYVLCNSTM